MSTVDVINKTKGTSLLSFANFKIGFLASLLVQPFEVIRTSSIINKSKFNGLSFGGMIDIIRHIRDTEGWKGFFRGGTMAMFKTTLSYGFFFVGLEEANKKTKEVKAQVKDQLHFTAGLVDFFNASASKTVSTVIVSPIVVIKTRCEVVGDSSNKHVMNIFRTIYRNEGLRGFYSGLGATLIRDVPYSGIQYSMYRFLLEIIPMKDPTKNKVVVASCSAIAAVWAVIVTHPFDNLRVRVQWNKFYGESSDAIQRLEELNKKMLQIMREVYETEGVGGFFKGYLPRLFKKAFSSALVWSLYENLKNRTEKDSPLN